MSIYFTLTRCQPPGGYYMDIIYGYIRYYRINEIEYYRKYLHIELFELNKVKFIIFNLDFLMIHTYYI